MMGELGPVLYGRDYGNQEIWFRRWR